jgi:hypothetical protein
MGPSSRILEGMQKLWHDVGDGKEKELYLLLKMRVLINFVFAVFVKFSADFL